MRLSDPDQQARAWARELLGPDISVKEDRMFTHKEYTVKFPVDAEAIRAEVARLNAEREREQERRRPTPAGTAKLVRTIFERNCLVRPIVDSEKVQQALVDALEPIFTTTWARGFDDGQAQLKEDLYGVLDDH
jgi:hypothetical protein